MSVTANVAVNSAKETSKEDNISTILSHADKNGRTALYWAVVNKNEALIRFFLSKMTIDSVSKAALDTGYTVLHVAIQSGMIESVRMIVEKAPALINKEDKYGQTVFHWAAKGKPEITEYLLAKIKGESQVHTKHESELKILSNKDSNGYTALHVAVRSGNLPVVNILLEKAPTLIQAVDNYGQTALHWAASKWIDNLSETDLKITQELFNRMDDKDILKETNEYGYTALHLAIHSNSQKTVEIFLKKNIPDLLGKQDKYGQTALHWAVSKGNLSIIESLLNAMSDADILKITKEKATVLNFAKTHEIVEMLTKRLPEVITGYIASNSKREDLAKSESETHQQTLPAAPITFSIPKEESSKKPTSVNTQSESDGVYKNGK